ncbi:Histone H2A type 1 [Taenia solium]|eukprot:TsM_000986700 transcript=TsM_000986700 gene=TsM_000986700
MKGRGGGDKSGAKAKAKSTPVCRLLRRGNYAERVNAGAPVYLDAVVLAIRNTKKLNELLGVVTIRQGGVPLNIGGAAAKEDGEVGSHHGVGSERDNGSLGGHHKGDC